MAKTGLEYQITVRAKLHEDGRLLFTRRPTMSQRLLDYMVPTLWLTVLVVLAAVVFLAG